VSEASTVDRVDEARPEQGANSAHEPEIPDSELAIQVEGVSKSFRIPVERPATDGGLVARARRRLQGTPHHELEVLRDISFGVRRGELFGIAGRNGSGKSTLLQLLAGIYGVNRGRIRVAGRVAPIINLGVGFHPMLNARENVEVNAVMMGLTQREARARVDEIIAMAGLKEFSEMRLRNYSSGMRVRLAFSVVAHVDGDVLLLDEVLAVGDDSFQRTCEAAFERLIESKKTIILVTHSMPRLESLCDRAMLLHDGRIERFGDPSEVARRYVELNYGGKVTRAGDRARHEKLTAAAIVDLWLEDPQGNRVNAVRQEGQIELHAMVEAGEQLDDPRFRFEIRSRERGRIFGSDGSRLSGPGRNRILHAGSRVEVVAKLDNPLAPDRYSATFAVTHSQGDDRARAAEPKTVDFAVVGADNMRGGLISLDYEVEVKPR
jgi:ABC-type polysaccharide/polyol phosphate transport system ATPase subunit